MKKSRKISFYTLVMINSMRNSSSPKPHNYIAQSIGIEYDEYMKQLKMYEDNGVMNIVRNYVRNANKEKCAA